MVLLRVDGGRLAGTNFSSVVLLGLLLVGAEVADCRRPDDGAKAKQRQRRAQVGDFDPQQMEKVKEKVGTIKTAVDGLANGAATAESTAAEVKDRFNKYNDQIRVLHGALDELMVKRHAYAEEIFNFIRDSEHNRIGPILHPRAVSKKQSSDLQTSEALEVGKGKSKALLNSSATKEEARMGLEATSFKMNAKGEASNGPVEASPKSSSTQEAKAVLEEASSRPTMLGEAGASAKPGAAQEASGGPEEAPSQSSVIQENGGPQEAPSRLMEDASTQKEEASPKTDVIQEASGSSVQGEKH
mmetsp:Transcript_141160/g.352066  ORF Transcript_141160/g.352066 Transcript_141160/m.352066 type:complete len:300 (+) Transcript_141160:165-1064(+)